jgi:dihydroorotate dehydrogenase electron transfer subunit
LKQLTATISSNIELLSYPGAGYFRLRIQAPDIAYASSPGQFLMLKCGNDALLRRPISIHSVSTTGELDLLYSVPHPADSEIGQRKAVGTRWLAGLAIDDEIDVVGPLGNGFQVEPWAQHLLIIAGGIGVAPLRFLAERTLSQGKKVTLLLGARTAAAVLPESLLPAGANLIVTTEDASFGQKGLITDFVPEYIGSADQIFACGPEPMYRSLSQLVESWSTQKQCQVSLEVRMGCGTGVCYSCSIKTRQGMRRVCKEGPVFNIKDIIWQEVTT